MSSSSAPLFPTTPVFIPAYWTTERSGALTQEQADALYLKFPVGQGTESIPNLIVSGTSTLGITSASTLSITDTTNNALTIGNLTTATGNMNFGAGVIQRLIATAGTNQTLTLYCENTALSSQASFVTLRSGNNSTIRAQVELDALSDDGYKRSNLLLSERFFDLNNSFVDAETTYTSGVLNYDDPSTGVPEAILYSNFTSPTDNYIGMRAKTNTSSAQFLEMFVGGDLNQAVNIAQFTGALITFYVNQTFSGNTGVLEKSTILTASTTGNYTMTSANAFLTTINTPTASRNFILPATAGQSVGTFYGICNRSTSFTIAVQFPSGTTIFTIPVATNATNGGSFAKFAIASGGTTYFRCG
jgi:hypothetical protein